MAPVIDNAPLYCTDSILFENDALDGCISFRTINNGK